MESPPQQDPLHYRVKVRGCPPDRLSRNRLAWLAVSLGNETHYGERFEALLDWAVTHHERVVIGVTDLAYRHNYRIEGLGQVAARSLAIQRGSEWLEQHAEILEAHRSRILAIHRWQEWLESPGYPAIRTRLEDHYRNDPSFRSSVESDVASFTERYVHRHPGVDEILVSAMSRRFVMEECAVYVMIGRRYTANRLYPGQDLCSMSHLRHPDTPAELKGIGNLAHVRLLLKHGKGDDSPEASRGSSRDRTRSGSDSPN